MQYPDDPIPVPVLPNTARSQEIKLGHKPQHTDFTGWCLFTYLKNLRCILGRRCTINTTNTWPLALGPLHKPVLTQKAPTTAKQPWAAPLQPHHASPTLLPRWMGARSSPALLAIPSSPAGQLRGGQHVNKPAHPRVMPCKNPTPWAAPATRCCPVPALRGWGRAGAGGCATSLEQGHPGAQS